MSFDVMGRRVPDYDICSYDGSRLTFRGPKPDLSRPYVAFLGTTDTFGKLVERPFPELLADHLPVSAVNLGMQNGGVDAYLGDPAVIEVAKQAQLRVVQVIGALNLSNHYFKVHPRRNDRFIAANEGLRRLFPEVDFAHFHFTKAMLNALKDCSDKRYRMVCKELQDIWLARMTMLLTLLGERTILLWIGQKPPVQDATLEPSEPMLVDADMIARMRQKTSTYIENIQPAPPPVEGKVLNGSLERVAAGMIMSPSQHVQTAQMLQEACIDLMH